MRINSDKKEKIVVNNRNNPSVPDGVNKNKITRQGVGLIDFTGDESFSFDNESQAEGRSFSTLAKLSTRGGYGVIHTKGFETVVVGRIAPPCVMFPRLGEGEDARSYKAFAFTEYAEVDLDRFPELHDAISNRTHMPTLHQVKKGSENPGSEAVVSAFTELEMEGRVEFFRGLDI